MMAITGCSVKSATVPAVGGFDVPDGHHRECWAKKSKSFLQSQVVYGVG